MQEQASSRTPSAATPPCTLPCRPPRASHSSPAVVVLLPSLLPPCRCFSLLPEMTWHPDIWDPSGSHVDSTVT